MQKLLETLPLQLHQYQKYWAEMDFPTEFNSLESMVKLDEQSPKSYFRDHFLPGHFTGSALVVDPSMTQVLLTLHSKLNMWIQLGGHADGDTDLYEVAFREACEESGLYSITPYRNAAFNTLGQDFMMPFDIDIHTIPAHKDEPEHQHFDVRFLFTADPFETLTITNESKALKWLTLSEAKKLTSEMGMLRQFAKVDHLRRLTLH